VRYYYSYLNFKQPLLYQLVPVIGKQFEQVFPELEKQLDFVTKVVREEEEGFLRTLEKGLKRIDDIIKSPKVVSDKMVISGKDAFELYDTYGFPVDLTRLIASENNLTVDEPGFETEMKEQKNRSRAATAIDTEDWVEINKVDKTSFVGYNDLLVETQVTKYRKAKTKGKEQYQFVLETT